MALVTAFNDSVYDNVNSIVIYRKAWIFQFSKLIKKRLEYKKIIYIHLL